MYVVAVTDASFGESFASFADSLEHFVQLNGIDSSTARGGAVGNNLSCIGYVLIQKKTTAAAKMSDSNMDAIIMIIIIIIFFTLGIYSRGRYKIDEIIIII